MTRRLERAALLAQFAARFPEAGQPSVFRAPGRLNIIGEHVDYCGGPVLPAAIDRHVAVAITGNDMGQLRVSSPFGDAELPLDRFERKGDWRDHVAGMAMALRDAGVEVRGADIQIDADLPAGAGASSSAALASALALALTAQAGISAPDRVMLARAAQASENDYVGMPCGVMDAFASLHGRPGHALALDCGTLTFEAVPVPAEARFLLIDSGVRHVLTDGGYAERFADCQSAARTLGVTRLADIPEADWTAAATRLSGNPLRRARHVIGEIARTRQAIAALRSGDLKALGALMSASHNSLSTDMQVSTPEVDALAKAAQATPGVLGARIMGGGFGGSVIALTSAGDAEPALASVIAAHSDWLGRPVEGFVAGISDGAGAWDP